MKTTVLFLLCILFASISIKASDQHSQNTILVFYVKHYDNPENDYVELSLKLQTKHDSLTQALKNANQNVQHIKTIAHNFCQQNSKKNAQCKDIIDIADFQIHPKYQMIRKAPVFMGFTITHDITIAVKSTQNIGYLVDKIKEKQGVTLEGFQWKASKEHNVRQQAIAEGMQQSQGLCHQLNLQFLKVITAQQVYGSEAEAGADLADEDGEEDEQESEQQGTPSVFKFEVECAGKVKTKKQ